jgi:hypothetical protein
LRKAFAERSQIRRSPRRHCAALIASLSADASFSPRARRAVALRAARRTDYTTASVRAARGGIGHGLAGFRLKTGDTRGETVDGGSKLWSRWRGRGLDREGIPASANYHQRSRNRTGDRGDDRGETGGAERRRNSIGGWLLR